MNNSISDDDEAVSSTEQSNSLDRKPDPEPENSEPIVQDVLGRTSQFKQLNQATLKTASLPSALFLWGATSTGKSHTITQVLQGKNFHVIRIHSSEILCGRRAFYETFMQQLVNSTPAWEAVKCDSLRSLYSNIVNYIVEDKRYKSLRVVAIIEGVESLTGEYDDVLKFFVSLQNITQACICSILISSLPPNEFMPNVMDHSIIPIYFPQYTMEEITNIMIQENLAKCSGTNSGIYEFYIKTIVSMFYYICRDLRKLSRLARSHWENFVSLVENSDEGTVKLPKLWKNLEPQLKKQFFELNSSVASITTSGDPMDLENSRKVLDMPLNAKYILIASYLATHNPPASDKRFFVRAKVSKTKKRRANADAGANSKSNTLARSFELNRLSAIFGFIQLYCNENAVNKSSNITFVTLLTTLCQNKFIQHLGEDTTGNQKYKCLMDYDTVMDISKSVNFELNNYLHRLL